MKITLAYLKKQNACKSGIVECEKWGIIGQEHKPFIRRLMDENHYDYATWLIVRLLKTEGKKVRYAIYAASLVLKNYEIKYPDDKRPRKAINAARRYLKTKSWSAAWSAWSAAWSAWGAAESAWSAAWGSALSAAKLRIKIINYGLRLIEEVKRG